MVYPLSQKRIPNKVCDSHWWLLLHNVDVTCHQYSCLPEKRGKYQGPSSEFPAEFFGQCKSPRIPDTSFSMWFIHPSWNRIIIEILSKFECFSFVIVLLYVLQTKCHQYWPDKSETYHKITVSNHKTEKFADYAVRTFVLSKVCAFSTSSQQPKCTKIPNLFWLIVLFLSLYRLHILKNIEKNSGGETWTGSLGPKLGPGSPQISLSRHE